MSDNLVQTILHRGLILLALVGLGGLGGCSGSSDLQSALEQIELGNFDRARTTLKKTIEETPTSDRARYFLGRLLYREGRYKKALHQLKTVDSYRNRTPRVGTTQAAALLKLERYEAALSTLEPVLKRFKTRGWLYDPFRQSFLNATFDTGARRKLRRTLTYSAGVSTIYWITSFFVDRGETRFALDVYNARLNNGTTIDLRKAFVKFLLKTGHYDLAMDQLQRLKNIEGDTPRADFYRGKILYEQKRYNRSLHFFRRAYHRNFRPPTLLVLYAGSLRNLGRTKPAVHIVNEALKTYPKTPAPHVARAELLKRLKPGQPAIWWSYYRALEYETHDATILNELGKLFLNYSRAYEKALLYFDLALEVNPGLEVAQYHRAVTLSKMGHNDRALETLNQLKKHRTLKDPLKKKINRLRRRLKVSL